MTCCPTRGTPPPSSASGSLCSVLQQNVSAGNNTDANLIDTALSRGHSLVLVCSGDFGFSIGQQSCLASSKYMFYTLHTFYTNIHVFCEKEILQKYF